MLFTSKAAKRTLSKHPFKPEWRISKEGAALIERYAQRLPRTAKVIEFGPGFSTVPLLEFEYFGVDGDHKWAKENLAWLEENNLEANILLCTMMSPLLPPPIWYNLALSDFPFIEADMVVIDGPANRFGGKALAVYKHISKPDTVFILDDSQGWETPKLLEVWGGDYREETVYDSDPERRYRTTTAFFR